MNVKNFSLKKYKIPSSQSLTFTLIELLLVVAIISIFNVHALQKAREIAQRNVCANNLNEIGLGHVFYSEDYNDNMIDYWKS